MKIKTMKNQKKVILVVSLVLLLTVVVLVGVSKSEQNTQSNAAAGMDQNIYSSDQSMLQYLQSNE
jgi:hypothetical protein